MTGALERPASARQAYLREACAGDEELRAEVESLLVSHDEAGDFIESSAIDSLSGYVEPIQELQPGNSRVTDDGTPKLLDFGIAKMLDPDVSTPEATVTMTRMMTPEYASPEQIRGEPINTSTDIYSLGVILYEILTGHRPYRF